MIAHGRVARRGPARRSVALLSPWLLAACAVGPSGGGDARRYLALELVREAHVEGELAQVAVSACRWHVSGDGALYGDHWGWCEDYRTLPAGSPGYLLLTTLFSGGAAGGFARLVVLPPRRDGQVAPDGVEAFGKRVRAEAVGSAVRLEFGAAAATLAPAQRAALGTERGVVEPPEDTGHFEPGYDQPLRADLTFSAIHHGWLDPRRIAGRSS